MKCILDIFSVQIVHCLIFYADINPGSQFLPKCLLLIVIKSEATDKMHGLSILVLNLLEDSVPKIVKVLKKYRHREWHRIYRQIYLFPLSLGSSHLHIHRKAFLRNTREHISNNCMQRWRDYKLNQKSIHETRSTLLSNWSLWRTQELDFQAVVEFTMKKQVQLID